MNEQQSRIAAPSGVRFHHAGAFWFGVVAVTAGVIAHMPMYLMGKDIGYRLAGMPMDTPMLIGMGAIVVGFIASLYGLLPPSSAANSRIASHVRVRALDDAPLSWAHVGLLLTMAVAVTIDVMKPTALAFVMPGITMEYGLKSPLNPTGTVPAAWLALSGIVGTVLGSFLWGWLGDRIGRRASILYAGIGFIGTSICGAMPTLRMESGHVLAHGHRGRRHASDLLCAVGRNYSRATSRLADDLDRGGHRRRLHLDQLARRRIGAHLQLANPVADRPSDRRGVHLAQSLDS